MVFKYSFVDTGLSWPSGASYTSLSFSSDGTTLGGAVAMNSPNFVNGKVQYWDSATGTATSTFSDYSFISFSPKDPDVALTLGLSGIRLMLRDSPGAKTWHEGAVHSYFNAPTIASFRSDGLKITVWGKEGRLYEVDKATFPALPRYTEVFSFKVSSIIYCPFEIDTLVAFREDGQSNMIMSYVNLGSHKLISQFSNTVVTKITASAWSHDGKWIATGENGGDIRLWNASVTSNVSIATTLPRKRTDPINSLIFVPDNTALVILTGGYLFVWDIEKGNYVTNSGLPTTAKGIALDGPRNRAAVAVDEKIFIYDLKVVQEKPKSKKNPSIPAELSEFDISDKVVKSKPDPFVGLYFDIYRGAWKLDKPRVFQHVVAVKALRTGYNPSSKAQERKEFDDLLTKCLATWLKLSHDNIVPLLGVSINFGRFPAMVTSWMINGLLSEYLKSEEEFDQMELVKGVANGVAYLHSKNIVHSDLRASSVLVDELGNARLADPGLLSILTNSPLIVAGMMNAPYRWMAPELLRDSSTKTNFKTDVYSFTMTSLEIYTAAQPFEGVQDALVPGKILQNQRPDKPNDVSQGLWVLWADGWNDDPAKRPDMTNYVQRLNPLS